MVPRNPEIDLISGKVGFAFRLTVEQPENGGRNKMYQCAGWQKYTRIFTATWFADDQKSKL